MFAVKEEDHFSSPDKHRQDTNEYLHDLELVFNLHITKIGIEVIRMMIQALTEALDVTYD